LVDFVQDVAIPEELAAVVAQWRDAGSPPRPPTRWRRESWHRRLPEHRALLDDLPSDLDRDAVTVHARAIDGPAAAVRAFIATVDGQVSARHLLAQHS
jgi:hypothetical protein